MRALLLCIFAWCLSLSMVACGQRDHATSSTDDPAEAAPRKDKLPFKVQGEAEGFLMVWFDQEGPHLASKRSEIPANARSRVKVDSNALFPNERLDTDWVYVADMRQAKADGSYPACTVSREQFEQWIDQAQSEKLKEQNVVLYRTAWCGVCKKAAAFFKQQGIVFAEKDIEKDPQAGAELRTKCQQARLSCQGVPVIDIDGQLIEGFNPATIKKLL